MELEKVILLRLERFLFEPDCTVSRLFFREQFLCYVMEDEIRKIKVKNETAIPAGIYKLGLRPSPKFSKFYHFNEEFKVINQSKSGNHKLIWIKDIPNFEFVLIHWGNTDDDTSGCLLVGSKVGKIGVQTAVLNSRVTYELIYPKIWRALQEENKEFYIEIL